MSQPKSFGAAAMQVRKNAGLSLREAARRLAQSPSYVSKIELDRCAPPSGDLIRRMAQLYAVPIDLLLTHAKEREPDVIAMRARDNAALCALYRITGDLPTAEILRLIKELVNKLLPEDRGSWAASLDA